MRTKMSNGKISGSVVAVCAIIIALVLGFFYFGSDVFRTRANASYKEFSSWTPENIAKFPQEYLVFCEEQTKQAIEKLKASEIGIAQKYAMLDTSLEEAEGKVKVGGAAIDDLKSKYRDAEKSDLFPIEWRDGKLDKDQAKRQIVRLSSQIETKKNLVSKYKSALNQLNVQKTKVQDARDQAKEQLAKIAANREMLKVQDVSKDIRDGLVAMKGVIETSIVGVASTDSGALSLEEIAMQDEGTVDDSEFDKIMSK